MVDKLAKGSEKKEESLNLDTSGDQNGTCILLMTFGVDTSIHTLTEGECHFYEVDGSKCQPNLIKIKLLRSAPYILMQSLRHGSKKSGLIRLGVIFSVKR